MPVSKGQSVNFLKGIDVCENYYCHCMIRVAVILSKSVHEKVTRFSEYLMFYSEKMY